jgi:hypothetical protein
LPVKLLLTEELWRIILHIRFFQESIVASRPHETDAATVGAFKESAESTRLVRVTVLSNLHGLRTVQAHVAQLVEHVLGKDEVTGSIPVMGSRGTNHHTKNNHQHKQALWQKKPSNAKRIT